MQYYIICYFLNEELKLKKGYMCDIPIWTHFTFSKMD